MRMHLSILILVTMFLVTSVLIFGVVFYQVHDDSMSPTLISGNKIMVDRISPKFFGIKKGDIVVYELDSKQLVVKRCFLAPHDLMDEALRLLLMSDEGGLELEMARTTMRQLTKIPDGYYFFMGDNSAFSNDSRDYGLISHKKIIGKVIGWSIR